MYTPETSAKLALYRQKAADKTLTDEELQEAVNLLRAERRSAVENSVKRRQKARAAVKSGDDLLAELEGLK